MCCLSKSVSKGCERLGNLYAFGKQKIADKARTAQELLVEKIYARCSPWAVADQATRRAELGAALPIESVQMMDLSQFLFRDSWEECFRSLRTLKRTVHVVNDKDLIRQGIQKEGRESDLYDPYPTIIDTVIDTDNMLRCPSSEHARLRSKGLASVFATGGLKRACPEGYLKTLANVLRLGGGVMDNIRDHIIDALEDEQLSRAEADSTRSMLGRASRHTTNETTNFMLNLLNSHSQWTLQMQKEWEERFGKIIGSDYDGPELPTQLALFIEGGEWKGKEINPSPTLQAVVKETLRLFPVIPQIVRVAKTRFELGDTLIEAGDVLMFNVMGAQRDARIWENPTTFDPARFLKEGEFVNHPLLNFSMGPERCLGQKVAESALLIRTALKMNIDFRNGPKSESGPRVHYRMTPPFLSIARLS